MEPALILSSTLAAQGALGLALLSAAALGFRHGLDHDHIAAITDIANVEGEPRRAMKLGLLYVAGHAATVIALGCVALVLGASVPKAVDGMFGRLVGLTLLALGLYVAATLVMHRHGEFQPRARATVLISGFFWVFWKLERLFRTNDAPRRDPLAKGYGNRSAFVIGIIHGVGAETPTQILLFLLAANLGGPAAGLAGILAFVAGLVVMNTLICASAAGLVRAGASRPMLSRWIAGATAAYSLILGVMFLAAP